MTRPVPTKLFCGLIGNRASIEQALEHLVSHFGPVDCESAILHFDFTDYYAAEMGKSLMRKWAAFRDLKARGYLARAKRATVALEEDLARAKRRTVNIDPGYVDNAQVVLATAKNFSHRIYIGMGYYAEVTLIYSGGGFKPLEWTYPDYRSDAGLEFFHRVRSVYHETLRSGNEA